MATSTLADLFVQISMERPEELLWWQREVSTHPVFAPMLSRLESLYVGPLPRGTPAYWQAVRHVFRLDMMVAHEDRHPAELMICRHEDLEVLLDLCIGCIEESDDAELCARLHGVHCKIACLVRAHRRAAERLRLRAGNMASLPRLKS